MLTVMCKRGVLGDGLVEREQFPFTEGETARTLVRRVQHHLPKSVPIDVSMRGRLLEDAEYDEPLSDWDELVFCGHVAAGVDIAVLILQAVIAAALSVAVNYALAALNPQPSVPDVPQDRGDQTSQTYAWSGIQTNYGQGFIVPAVYGRHGVGGQVISTDVSTGAALLTGGNYLSDKLNILLALSEGPIDKVGDVTVLQEGNDFLGSQVGGPTSQGSLPNFIRVNDVMLANDGNAVFGQQVPGANLNAIWFGTTTPDLQEGDILYAYDNAFSVSLTGSARVIRYVYQGSAPGGNSTILLVLDAIPAVWSTYIASTPGANVRIGIFPNINPSRFALYPSSETVTLVPEAAGAMAFLRKGTLDQLPVPSSNTGGPFIGASVTFSPQNALNEFGDDAIYVFNSGDDPLSRVVFVLSAPVGLYQQSQQGEFDPYPVFFNFQWRYEGETSWRNFSNPTGEFIGTTVRTGPWSYTINRTFSEPVTGNIEVRVLRTIPAGGTGTVSSVVWRDVVFGTGYVLGYPRVACLGLSLEAGARWNGGLPNLNVRCDGIQLRIWDTVEGWSERTWEVPAAPFDWHINPPGRNPAWILLDFLLADWGLGHYLTEADIDLASFAAWAVYCDEDPGDVTPWNEPRYTCDIVMDRSRPAWEWVLAICATGRASPVFLDGKIGIVYEYRDAHAQGNVSVPAKSVQQLFTTTNLSDLNITWLPKATRPTSFTYQFLNEDFEWRQDTIPFEDEEGTFNDSSELFPDEYRPQQVQAFGQTRPTQLYRDSVYRHRINRLVTRKIDFKTGRWALASQIGDLIDVEAEVMRPFPDAPASLVADVATSAAVWENAVASKTLLVDHGNIPASGAIKIRQPDGTPVVTTYTINTTLTLHGRFVALIDTVATLTVNKGAPCVIGTVAKLTETYQIVAVTVDDKLEHTVTALQWAPEVHDIVEGDAYEDGMTTSLVLDSPATQEDPAIMSREIALNLIDGVQRVEFARLPQRQSVLARVYIREAFGEQWQLIGETLGNSVDIPKRLAHRTLEVSIAFESFDGEGVTPEAGVIKQLVVPEFSQIVAPPVTNPVWHEVQGTLMLTWDEITTRGVAFYEIREGINWNGGRVLARTADTRFVFQTPPQSSNVMVAVQLLDGSQGNPLIVAGVPTWEPYDTYKVVSRDELALHTGTATMVGVQIGGSGQAELEDDLFSGTYTTSTVDAGFIAPLLWRVNVEVHEYDAATVDDLDFTLASGEAAWWTVDGRGASPGLPGVDWERTVDDLSELTVDSLQDELVHGPRGEAGSHTRVLLESRFTVDNEAGPWSEWAEHLDGVRVSRFAEFRLTLDRETLTHEAQVHEFVIVAHI